MIRLDKLLAHNGYGTRKEVKKLIRLGFVKVDHIIIKDDDFKLDETKSIVSVNDEIVNHQDKLYLMMNKPQDYVCANHDEIHATVFDLIADYNVNKLFCVGRLDIDTTGLLLITNDGDFAHNITKPKKQIKKTYYAKLMGQIDVSAFILLEKGVIIDGGLQCLPAIVELIEQCVDYAIVKLIIEEGKFHQVKRMFKAINMEVIELKRTKIGNLELDNRLELGEYRLLEDSEVKKIFETSYL
ncbi:rRNA pseudouridine synthase [Erysipelotrichaceae bacterium OttesenSCG-928-M19]|nr:rRNA pseudouridine synthase [Erysipelotrichaceae bacterium OttesenSCG-928-M19]